MSHNLAITNGKTTMMYVGETPWHRLGTKLNNPATAEEAITAAGLNFDVRLAALDTVDGLSVPQRKAVVRCDTQDVLGVVGNNYVPIQNRQCFGFLDAVVADGKVHYHTAGALGKGEKIWLLAKIPEQIRVRNSDDFVDKFLLLSNAHDGSAALRVFFTPIRVVCQNTLNLAEGKGKGQGISIMHKGDLTSKIREAQRVLGLAERFYDDAAEKIDFLAGHLPNSQQIRTFFQSLYPDPENSENNRSRNIRNQLTRLFESGIGQDIPGIRLTSWAAYNAVTEFIDHHRSSCGGNNQAKDSKRLKSAWFGSGSRLKARAWNLALQMAADN